MLELKDKIKVVNELKKNQKMCEEELVKAKENNDVEQINKLTEEIQKLKSNIEKLNNDYNKELENRPEEEKIQEEAKSFLKKGTDINKDIEEYTAMLNKDDVSAEDKFKISKKLEDLKKSKSRLKGEIYAAALKKSGLKYNEGEISPSEIIKKGMEKIASLEAERENIIKQNEKQKEIAEKRKSEMDEQFNIAKQKYQEMFESGKISRELCLKRINNMREAKDKDIQKMYGSFSDFSRKLRDNTKETQSARKELEENKAKFAIYDEYDKAYYDIFGESLDKFAKERFDILQNSVSKNSSEKRENEAKNMQRVENSRENDDKQSKAQNVANGVQVQSIPEKELDDKDPLIINVTSKTMFNDLYKKLSKGNITDEELAALSRVLENEENYDKYGITTGLVFNKAKKILKLQGARTAKNIEEFLAKSGQFSNDIMFDTSIEGDEVLSHDLLNSWKDISNQLVFTDKELSVERYINKIEEYKEEGNTLTPEQEKMYKEASKIKNELAGYKKAINANETIAIDRDFKMHNSVFYNMFRNTFGKGRKNALPEVASPAKENETAIVENVLDLSELVQSDEERVEMDSQETTRDRSIDDNMVR